MDALRFDSYSPNRRKNQIGFSKNHKIIEKRKSELANNTMENKIKSTKSTQKNS